MINTLIVDDNLQYVKNILNTILNNFKEIRVTHIATTGKEAVDIITNNYIDLIFLDLKLPDFSGIEIIQRINFLNYIKNPTIIVISGDMSLSNKVPREYNICDVISKSENSDILYSRIKQIIHREIICHEKENIKEEISKELTKMGYNWKYKGTHYILESILYIYESNNMNLLDNLEKNVYQYVAFKNNKSVNNIKTNSIKCTNLLEWHKYFLEKPTPKLVISQILTKIVI